MRGGVPLAQAFQPQLTFTLALHLAPKSPSPLFLSLMLIPKGLWDIYFSMIIWWFGVVGFCLCVYMLFTGHEFRKVANHGVIGVHSRSISCQQDVPKRGMSIGCQRLFVMVVVSAL